MTDYTEPLGYEHSPAAGSRWVQAMLILFLVLALAVTLPRALAAGSPPSAPSTQPSAAPAPQPSSSPPPLPSPLVSLASAEKSGNWAGYVAGQDLSLPQAGSVSDVRGAWIVPAANSAPGQRDAFAATWVGIGGYSFRTIQQIGTDSDLSRGVPTYYAWYEMLPDSPVPIDMRISPGDSVSAEVRYLGNDMFLLGISDATTGQSFSTVQVQPGAARETAEWIVEAPSLGRRTLPLEDFGTLQFTSASATIGSIAGEITDPAWQYAPIVIEKGNGVIGAVPTELSQSGAGFGVAWMSP
jgi:hypothetical protein